MARKNKTTEQFKSEIYNLVGNEYTILGDYIKSTVKILIRHNCEKCNHNEFMITPSHFLLGQRCNVCSSKLKTQKEYENELQNVNPNIKVIGTYTGIDNSIEHECLICGNKWNAHPSYILHTGNCPKCSYKQLSINMRKSHETFVKDVYELSKDEYTVLGTYVNAKTKVKMKHNKCGTEFYITPDDFLSGKGCKKCSSSKGEKIINDFLLKNNIKFIAQYKFCDCIDKRKLPFDFAIFSNNKLISLIEFDGKQHFEPWHKGNDVNERLQITQYHDMIKTNYCINHDIKLIRIPYWNLKNIEEILHKELEIKPSSLFIA